MMQTQTIAGGRGRAGQQGSQRDVMSQIKTWKVDTQTGRRIGQDRTNLSLSVYARIEPVPENGRYLCC